MLLYPHNTKISQQVWSYILFWLLPGSCFKFFDRKVHHAFKWTFSVLYDWGEISSSVRTSPFIFLFSSQHGHSSPLASQSLHPRTGPDTLFLHSPPFFSFSSFFILFSATNLFSRICFPCLEYLSSRIYCFPLMPLSVLSPNCEFLLRLLFLSDRYTNTDRLTCILLSTHKYTAKHTISEMFH